jgi:hypothetical protein
MTAPAPTVGELAGRQEATRLAMLAAEDAAKVARRAFNDACEARRLAARKVLHDRRNPPMFGPVQS